jgi:hypothetical protein
LPSKVIAADACVLLNFLATGRADDLLRALDLSLIATPLAAAQVKYLAGPPDEEGRPTRQPVDLIALTSAGLLSVKEVPHAMLDLYIRCAAAIHEADASSIALAAGFGVPLATDDGLERRVAAREEPQLEVVGTLALLRKGTLAMSLGQEDLARIARALRFQGNFLPPRQDPDRDWYQQLLSVPF